MASAAEESPNSLEVSEELIGDTRALNEYWTEDAMAEATPLEQVLDDDSRVAAFSEDELERDEEVVLTEPEYPESAAPEGWDPQPHCPSSGSNTERVPNRKIIPYSPVGKMFMTFDGKNYVGSAWVVAGAGVFTAGHCVFEKSLGGFADKVLFVPQYHKGQEPLGRWAATRMAALKGWTGKRDFKYDIGCFKVDRPIQPRTGSLGWIANAKPNLGCITSIGYPAASPFDGREMWRSTGKNLGGSNPIKMANDMTGGCSGGPWEIWQKGAPYTQGVNSFRYRNDPKSMYSPYFGKGFLNLYNWVK